MKIGVIGAGRLGICFALLCEAAGYDVIVSDVREDYVKDLNQRKIFTNEPDVKNLLKTAKRFEATTDNQKVIKDCEIIFTLVATPSNEDGSYNVDSVWQVVDDIENCEFDVSGKSLVVGCTTNPGDCDLFQTKLNFCGVDVFYNPEFIAQGSIVKDLKNADMVLLGGDGNHLQDIISIYKGIQGYYPNVFPMSTKAAELTKIAVNCFLTTKISYANMIGQVMVRSGMSDEIDNVLAAIGSDSRIGSKYLKYGFGFGGPCFPRDNRAFASYTEEIGVEFNIGRTTDNFNEHHALFLKDFYVRKNPDKSVPFYFDYVSYKKGSDILTESQQYRLCKDLLSEGYVVYVNDIPDVIEMIRKPLSEQYGENVIFVNGDSIPSNTVIIN